MKWLVLIGVLVFALQGAAQTGDTLSIIGEWKVSDFSVTDTVDTDGSLKATAEQMKEIRQNALLGKFTFNEDHTFITVYGLYPDPKEGTWVLDEKEMTLELSIGSNPFGNYSVDYLNKKEMKWTLLTNRYGTMTMTLIKKQPK